VEIKPLLSDIITNWFVAVWIGNSQRARFCYWGTQNFMRAKDGYVAGIRTNTLKFILFIWFDQHATENSE
jgi:hypothetical protein